MNWSNSSPLGKASSKNKTYHLLGSYEPYNPTKKKTYPNKPKRLSPLLFAVGRRNSATAGFAAAVAALKPEESSKGLSLSSTKKSSGIADSWFKVITCETRDRKRVICTYKQTYTQ